MFHILWFSLAIKASDFILTHLYLELYFVLCIVLKTESLRQKD